jgi:hypothetical protein
MKNADWLRAHKARHDKQNSWWLNDAKGIPVSRVCDECVNAVKAGYAPEVFGGGHYEDVVEETIEPED